MAELNGDIVIACADLVGRAGAVEFEMGYVNDDPANPGWWAQALYRGAKIIKDGHGTPEAAALALATRLLSGATCRCTKPVTLSDDVRGACRWQLVGKRWEPGCDEKPVRVSGVRGDMAAMQAALGNRAERRAAARRGGRRG